MTELEWKEPIKIQDGTHTGLIVGVKERHDPYDYTDIVIKIDNLDFEIIYGCPTILSENSKLGKVLQSFGVESKPGTKADPEGILKDKRCTFMTIMKPAKDGKEYAEVVVDSLKPEVEIQKV